MSDPQSRVALRAESAMPAVLDTCGMVCPMPLLKTKQMLGQLAEGATLLVLSTDEGSRRDIPLYISLSSHSLLESGQDASGRFTFLIRKQSAVS